MIVIDATNAIAGRIGTYAAKSALKGEKVAIINSENAVITGKKKMILDFWIQKVARGTPKNGPFFSRMPDRLLRRIIRGMLPYKQPRGSVAYANIMCYVGVPEKIKDEPIKVPGSDVQKTKSLNYLSLGQLSKLLMSK